MGYKQILIVEDDPMVRTLFEIYVKNSGKYKLAGSVESAAMAEVYCITKQVDLVIMDICTSMHASGLVAAEKIKKNYPKIKILLMTSQPKCSFEILFYERQHCWIWSTGCKEICNQINDYKCCLSIDRLQIIAHR